MKLIRWGNTGHEKPGLLLQDGTRLDASGFGEDYDEAFFDSNGLWRLAEWLTRERPGLPEVAAETRLGPCVARPSKIVCIGLNYRDHARETNAAIPAEPILFFKASSALCGPNDPVIIPKGCEKLDWEVELAVVMGKAARYVDETSALECVAGYALHNDYSERALQLERGGQWVKGKSSDHFAPLGPFLATRDELDPSAVNLWLEVNGKRRQQSNTADMIFSVPFLVSYVSQFMTLLPGDVISTGTPAGVGLGFTPPTFLRPGDVCELGIEGLGSSRQEVVSWDAAR